ncbi:hypothetical protein NA57DRAFT_51756 [Rhizodiscina lignyota]|uniref:Rhodopsin domain-containing protein n=1 Tax=Rhizodiscina lignyota TaxID=1504668 RepID=A0A9P4MEZ9_9PEZI|nr:hypothetical protein NA57DRAFT_51756 [Rhizodiscina lignyota]
MAVSWILFVVAFVHVCLRIWSRRLIEKRFSADDWALVFATICTTALAGAITFSAHQGSWNGKPTSGTMKAMLAFNFIYWLAIGALKLSVLAFFYLILPSLRREKPYPLLRAGILIAMVLVSLHSIISASIIFFVCQPVSLLWTPETDLSSCIDLNSVQGIDSAINALTSALIVLLPTIFIIKSQIQCRHRAIFYAVCIVGLVSVLGSLSRVLTFFVFETMAESKRPSRLLFLPLFSMIEMTSGLTAVSLFRIDALLRRNEIPEGTLAGPSRRRSQRYTASASRRSGRRERASRPSTAQPMPRATQRSSTPYDLEKGTSVHIARTVTIKRKVDVDVPGNVVTAAQDGGVNRVTKPSEGSTISPSKDQKSEAQVKVSSLDRQIQNTTNTQVALPSPVRSTRKGSPWSSVLSSGMASQLLPSSVLFSAFTSRPTSINASATQLPSASESSAPKG